METIQSLVRAGVGQSLIPKMAVLENRSDTPVYRSLSAPKPGRSIVVAWPKSRPLSRAAEEFTKLLARRKENE